MIEPTREPEDRSSGNSVSSGSEVTAGSDERALFTIDPAKGTLETANAPARRLLAIPANAVLPVALDGAMPAIRRFRQIAAGARAEEIERLIFWRAGRVLPIEASVTRSSDENERTVLHVVAHAPPAAGATNGEQPPAEANETTPLSRQPAEAAQIAKSQVAKPQAAEAYGVDAVGQAIPTVRTDQETLREIARRIREGGTGEAHSAKDATGTAATAESVEPATDAETPAQTPLPPAPVPLRPVATRLKLQANDPRQLSKLAHELRTPLSAIMAAAEVMRDEQLGPMGNDRYPGYASDIRDSARHALDVVNTMLSGAPREQLQGEVVDLNEIAEAVVSAMHPVAEPSGITLEADCENGRLSVHGDATAIRQILFNLIANALKFTPQGGDVRVATGFLEDGTPYLVVRDTGEGMTEDEITRAFYASGARSGPRMGGGYGMGLPIVRSLAEAMGAAIEVDSARGRGTVVLVAFEHP